MSESFKTSYFNYLPNEMLIKILSNIDTFTLLSFCDVYQCDYFLQDRTVIRKIDLCKKYQLEDITQISNKIALEYVRTLNINGLYWIQAAKLRNIITSMVNLEVLSAIQTNLSLVDADTEVYSKIKIRKLGVSLNSSGRIIYRKLPTVETLYISIKVTNLFTPIGLMFIFPQLRKLWVDVEELSGREIVEYHVHDQSKSKLVCRINAPIAFFSVDHSWLTTYYNIKRPLQPYMICCEKFSDNQLSESGFQVESKLGSWQVLDEFCGPKPYGPKDARRLFLNEYTLDTIFFEELNFYQSAPFCNTRCREAVEDILKSPCCTRLKKLCVMMCLLFNKNASMFVDIEDPDSFSRKRICIEKPVSTHPAENIFKNFLRLEHLELYVCHKIVHHSAIHGYSLISLFEHLVTLIVEVPISVDGSFLIQVLQKCQNLQRLKVFSVTQNEKLNFNVHNAIASANSLKDFRYENHRMQLDKLIKNLCLIKSKKLERFVLICKEMDKFSATLLKQFLKMNPQLVFLYFLIYSCTEKSRRTIQAILNTYEKEHPSKVFIVSKGDEIGRPSCPRVGYSIPDVHFREMIKSVSNVANPNVLDEFEFF
ncbi:hypothetical protein Zmor_027348 [Zophobas morio]|uniref:F-box domain-containing protein n=1 Tax=Zophobas morio TaxID=2755281 RepID=A0AA38M2V0_9CUCU|nr:hypothetical protein Zmor_027348 [Zophobas morio]